jgi:hypothetical protein
VAGSVTSEGEKTTLTRGPELSAREREGGCGRLAAGVLGRLATWPTAKRKERLAGCGPIKKRKRELGQEERREAGLSGRN